MLFTVKQARLLADKNQAETARAIGVCEQTYRRIEKKPSSATISQARALANFFGISMERIFFDDDSSLIRETDTIVDDRSKPITSSTSKEAS